MAQTKGVLPYSTAARLVEQGHMTLEQLQAGQEKGEIGQPSANTRNYGADQAQYLEIVTYLKEVNESTVDHDFAVVGRKRKAEGE